MKFSASGLLAILLMICLSGPARAADDAKSRMDAAIAYEKVTPTKELTDSMLVELENNPQLALTPEENKILKESIDTDAMRKAMLDAMVKHFTTAEIEALTKFYGSAEGKSITKKMPAYMNEFMPLFQQQIGTVIQKLMDARAAKETPQP
jgi:uncharacterized protein